ncbi:hypothetical protein M9H77_30165 [Catharanthus roseus]|uniref:Uncharacterized protein n=1 Tax=Catharanthus roseus TaxID=4058 RepID=A0ACB9ZWH3_CATRO|nr:hypothetical protein M9H77_30165 [Catharanthus roseus]
MKKQVRHSAPYLIDDSETVIPYENSRHFYGSTGGNSLIKTSAQSSIMSQDTDLDNDKEDQRQPTQIGLFAKKLGIVLNKGISSLIIRGMATGSDPRSGLGCDSRTSPLGQPVVQLGPDQTGSQIKFSQPSSDRLRELVQADRSRAGPAF